MASKARALPRIHGDDTPVTGGLDDISRFLVDLPEPAMDTDDELVREILTLFALHPEMQSRYSEMDLRAMDDATRHVMLEQIRASLGIPPLRRHVR